LLHLCFWVLIIYLFLRWEKGVEILLARSTVFYWIGCCWFLLRNKISRTSGYLFWSFEASTLVFCCVVLRFVLFLLHLGLEGFVFGWWLCCVFFVLKIVQRFNISWNPRKPRSGREKISSLLESKGFWVLAWWCSSIHKKSFGALGDCVFDEVVTGFEVS
jgi:hypothetical protein